MLITTKGGQGIPINPYIKTVNDFYEEKNRQFNLLNPELPVYDQQGNLCLEELYEVEAELHWQHKDPFSTDENRNWYFEPLEKEEQGHILSVKIGQDTRQVYRIPSPVKQEKESVDEAAINFSNSWDRSTAAYYGFKEGANWQIQQSSTLIESNKVIELINKRADELKIVAKNYNNDTNLLSRAIELTDLIIKIKEL